MGRKAFDSAVVQRKEWRGGEAPPACWHPRELDGTIGPPLSDVRNAVLLYAELASSD